MASVILGLLVRLLCLPITYDYDMYHWGVIIQNINSGNGLYELNGYFYTPIWGYIMGFTDLIINTVSTLGEVGTRVTSLLPVEDLEMRHVATVVTPEFTIAMKIPLIIGDLIVAYLLYDFVKKRTEDPRKASLAFALWFLCPINIYMSSVQGMFDNYSALFLFISILLALKERYILSGAFLSTAILLKIFPVACIFVYLGLLTARHHSKRDFGLAFGKAFGGLVIGSLIWYIPNILEGNIIDTLTVATDRASNSSFGILDIWTYVAMVSCTILMFYFGHRMARTKENIDDKFLEYCTYCMCAMMFVSVSPQYVIAALPLIIVWLLNRNTSGIVICGLIGGGTMLSALFLNNFSLLMCTCSAWGIPTPEFIIDGLRWADDSLLLGTPVVLGYAMELFGLLCILLLFFKGGITRRYPGSEKVFCKLEKIGGASDE